LVKGFAKDDRPKALIEKLSEDLLAIFRAAPLLDAYDVYQHLMDYWSETMQDDCYLISDDGWHDAAHPRLIVEEKGNKAKSKPDFVIGKKRYQAQLISPALIIRRWFSDEQEIIEKFKADLAVLQQQIEEMTEEHGSDEGLLTDAANDKGKLTKASVAARLKDIKGDAEAADEIKALKDYIALVEKEAVTNGNLVETQEVLTAKVSARYPKLTEADVKTLVVDDKWLLVLASAVQGELDRVSQTLAGRIHQLAERYATPLPQIIDEAAAVAARVDRHLKKMGAIWK
jgi:type I restriction enzyme M protein